MKPMNSRGTRRIAVLASGNGSNLGAMFDHFDAIGDRRGGSIEVVASDKPNAGALERARSRSVPTALIATERRSDGVALAALLETHRIDLIVLAGYLQLVPVGVVREYEGRIVNIHPALLPAFGGAGMYGARVHRAVLAAGVRVTGVTAHFIDDEYDRGRIIAQWPVPVFAGDDERSLAARLLRVEHLIYPRVVDAVASGRTTLANCGGSPASQTSGPPSASPAPLASQVSDRPAFTLLPHEDSRLAENIGLALGC